MARPAAVLRLARECFRAPFACMGSQVARLALELEQLAGPLEWWVTDVEANLGDPPGGLGLGGVDRCGPTARFFDWAGEVSQFHRGTFLATPLGAGPAALPPIVGGLDDEWADLGGCAFKVRAFDTAFLLLSAAEGAPAAALAAERAAIPCAPPEWLAGSG